MLDQRYPDLESIPRRVFATLEALGRIERAVYVLHHVLGHSSREIAAALNMTEQAVRAALEHSLARLESARST